MMIVRSITTLVMFCAASQAVAAEKLVQSGRVIAYDACAACHQVLPRQTRPGGVYDPDENERVLAPTFAEIAAKHGEDEAYMRKAITLPTHPMREQSWNKADLDAVIAYLKSLKK